MRYHVPLLLLLLVIAQAGEVVDRIAVVVGKNAIKISDISNDLRVTAFLNDERLNINPQSRRKAAERLVDQAIIREQVVNGGYKLPGESEVTALLQQIQNDRFGGSVDRLRKALRS